ncbi:MAG: radical SAM protein [Anaerolineae bacterium]
MNAGLWAKQPYLLPVLSDERWQGYFNPTGPVGIVVLDAAAQRVLDAFDRPSSFEEAIACLEGMPDSAVRQTAATLSSVGLLESATSPTGPRGRASSFAAWLHVSEACNLACPYCYVEKRPQMMSPEAGISAVARLVEIACGHGYETLRLKYAGGEPTLNFSSIEAIHEYALWRTAEAGLSLEEVILTNGVGVTDRMLDMMANQGIDLMVSLDGDRAAHDRLRTRPNGKGTYAAVADTVARAMDRGLRPDISITLTALNLEGVPQAAAFALARDLPFSLNFYRECSTTGDLQAEPGQLVDTVLEVFDVIGAYPAYSPPLAGILDRVRLDVPHRYACAAGRDYVTVDLQGEIAACQMLLGEPWSHLAAEDPLAEVQQRGEAIFKAVDERADCGYCPWQMACGGGCPLLWGSTLHHTHCQVYQILLPTLARLEARRLIARKEEIP